MSEQHSGQYQGEPHAGVYRMAKGNVAEARHSKMNNKRKNYNPNNNADGAGPRHDNPPMEGHPSIGYESKKMRTLPYGVSDRTANSGGNRGALYGGESSGVKHLTEETYPPNYTLYSSQANIMTHPNRNAPMKNNSVNKWPNANPSSDLGPHKMYVNNEKKKDNYKSKNFMNNQNLNLYKYSNSWKNVRRMGGGGQNVSSREKGNQQKMKSGDEAGGAFGYGSGEQVGSVSGLSSGLISGPIGDPISNPIGNPNDNPHVNIPSCSAVPMMGTTRGNNLSYKRMNSLSFSRRTNFQKVVPAQKYTNKVYPNKALSNLSDRGNKEEVDNNVNVKGAGKQNFVLGKNRMIFQNKKWFDSNNTNDKGTAAGLGVHKGESSSSGRVDDDVVGGSPEQWDNNVNGGNKDNGGNEGTALPQENAHILETLSKYLNSVGNKGTADHNSIYKALTQNKSKESLMNLLDNIKLLEEEASKGMPPPGGTATGQSLVGGLYKAESRMMDESKNRVKFISSSFNELSSSMLSNVVRGEMSASGESVSSVLSNARGIHDVGAHNKVSHPRYDNIGGHKMDTSNFSCAEPLQMDLQNDFAPRGESSLSKVGKAAPGLYGIGDRGRHAIDAADVAEGAEAADAEKADGCASSVAIFRQLGKDHTTWDKWKHAVAKCNHQKTQTTFDKVEESMNSNIKITEIFKSSLFCSESKHIYKNALYINYKEIWMHSGKFLQLENIFHFGKAKEKKKETNIIEYAMNCSIPFSSFLFFFNNFYEITEYYQYKICFFLIYKIIIMHEDDEEYGRYYNLVIKILNENTLIFFLLVLINLMEKYSLKMVYFVNFIERLLPVVTKGPRVSAGASGMAASSPSTNPNGTDKRIFFNMLFFKLFRLIFYRIELFSTQKKHLLMLFLRYIKNFLLNICSSILITQYLFIKCVDLMNKYNNQQYILIKTTSMEIFLQLWNNDLLKLYILKIGNALVRFLIFMSNVEYVNKNIFPFILTPIENGNQVEMRDAIEGMLYRSRYYTQGRKRWKHYYKKFERTNKCSLLVRSYGVDDIQEVVLLPSHQKDEQQEQDQKEEEQNSVVEVPPGGTLRTDQYGNVRTDLRHDTLLEHIMQVRKSYNYYKILLPPDEKSCLKFILQLKNRNNNFHFDLFYNLFIESNLANLIHENKVIYYVEFIMSRGTNVKGDEQGEENFMKGCMSVRGLHGLVCAGEEGDVPISSSIYSHVDDVFHSVLRPDQQSGCVKEDDEDKEEEDQPARLKEQLLFDLHAIIQRRNCVMSKIYGAHIRLSFFFCVFFYKSYDIYRILSSALGTHARKFKNFKKENQKAIKFMNINNITHILTVTFLLKFLAHLGRSSPQGGALHLAATHGRDVPRLTPEEEDFLSCYRLLEHGLGKDISTASTFLNYLNNVILYLHERKRENLVLSMIITLTIYNFLTLIGKKQNRIEHLETLSLSEICNEIHNNCLIGLLLKENNYFIDSETKFTEVEDIYSVELNNHMKFIPTDINKEIFQLVHFKKYVFQKGAYKKIDIIKIGRRNPVNNLYTSEILNYIYYNTLYLLIHFVMNIRFYEAIFRRTYKVSGGMINQVDGEGVCSFVRTGGTFRWEGEVEEAQPNGQHPSLTIILKKQNGDTYWRKKRYIVKFYRKAKKRIVKNLKTYLVSSNVNKFMRSLEEDKFFLNLFFEFDNSPLFLHSILLQGGEHTDGGANEANSNTIPSVNTDANESGRLKAMGMPGSLLCRHVNILKGVHNFCLFVEDINKLISFVTHRGKGRCDMVKCTFANFPLVPVEDNFSVQFRFYTIVWSAWVERDSEDSPVGVSTGELCAPFTYGEQNECAFHFNELIDRVVSTIVDANYAKEKIVWWSEFFYSLGNFGVVNFHLLFYLCSLVRGLVWGGAEVGHYTHLDVNRRDHFPARFSHALRRKIQICEQIYVLYLFRIGLLLNVSLYEAFDLLTSLISAVFNFDFFQFYLKKKKYHVEQGTREEVQSFVNSVKEEAKNILTNYDVNVFVESIIHISDCVFFLKSVKILILKSYCFVNVLLHVLSLRKVIIDMSNVECVDLLEGETDIGEDTFPSASNSEEREKDSLPDWRNYDSAEESEKFSSSDSSEGHKVEDNLEGYGSFCRGRHLEKSADEALNNRMKNPKGDHGKNGGGRNGEKKKIWILHIFKYFDCHSFLCFGKDKTEEEHFYEKKKNFRNFFFPSNFKKWKKKKKSDQDLCKLVYTLKKRLIQNGNFLSMYKQAFYVKWTCLRIFILQKYRLKMFNSVEAFQYIYERMNSVARTENLFFKIPADMNWGASFEGCADIRHPFLICLCHISRQVGALLRHHRKMSDQLDETEQPAIRDSPEALPNEEEAKRQHQGEALYNEVNIYLNNFIFSFYPYLIKCRFSYDVFLRLLRIYLNMYLIMKERNARSVRSPIYLLLMIFVHHTHVCKYLMFSYLTRVKEYLRSPEQSEEDLHENSLPREALQVYFRESVEFFLQNCTQEHLQFDYVEISCDGNALSLFYHMLVGNFA
ncbi:hypothetical protein AK88_03233 [Plasmodium fragile]|uniref:Uncharacterized protein n=1 Tax=Plasmodium fragile TaxID=5857 RepID=A0A0D9QJ55_PLAFR|nr:uncharacterized protein AK88_03233 [Plasmodium fragile]KJP87065.1 hypothetical protein AK88_03233 [Plasmodium fragile]